MRGINTWSFTPYIRPIEDVFRVTVPYPLHICRIAPSVTSVSLEWTGTEAQIYTVYWKKDGESGYRSVQTEQKSIIIHRLENNTEYSCYVENQAGKSRERLFKTGYAPGTVVNYLHPGDAAYKFSGYSLCSPSLVRHPDGYLLASMDVYGSGTPQNLSFVFRSDDNGESWHYVCDLMPCFWGKLFFHKGKIYMLAMSDEYGDLLIGKYDGKNGFSMPSVIFRGSCNKGEAGFHKAPMPVISHDGRLWTAVDYGAWAVGIHTSALLSIDENADLLCAENWALTEPCPYDPAWEGAVKGKSAGCLEGNAIVSPDGKLYNILRYQTGGCEPCYGKAMVLCADAKNPEKRLTFEKVIAFPGNMSKFDILYDQKSKKYWSIISRITDDTAISSRNLLSLICSDNLDQWTLICDLLDWRDHAPQKVGFQYVSFLFDGDDILYLCRTALNGAKNFHDANYSTFHRVCNFREIRE